MRAFLTTFLVATLAIASASGELRRFQNKEKTKSFFAELTGYDAKTKRVTVRMKTNGRKSTFILDVLSDEDQQYVIKNGKRLAIGNDIRMSLDKFQDKSVKKLEPRIVNRIYPSGYAIKLTNRSRNRFKNITINYTLYYGVQGYLKPERSHKEETGTLTCEIITAQQTLTLRTKPIDIISGKLEPVIKNVRRRNANGEEYIEPVVEKPGGRRKDILLGCKVEILVDGEVVKSETDGTIGIEDPEDSE